ncbi:MAG: O-antigen ligase family protein [Deltaproteobacteria bacterium]|nr:O-antigen ligase family protein [Deltaproteobacteria bacterium]
MVIKISGNDSTQSLFSRVLNGGVFCLMGIFIFFNPFPHTTSIQEISFYLSVFLVILGIISKKMPFFFRSPLSLPLALFTLWAAIGLFFALDQENSLHDFYSHLLKYLMLYYMLINVFNSKKRLEWLSWIIIISATLFCVGALGYEYLILGENEYSTRFGVRFVQNPTNLMGVITLFAAILSTHHLTEKGRSWSYCTLLGFCLPALLAVTVLTESRSNFVALGMVAAILLSKYKRALLAFVVLFALIICLTPMKDRFFLSESEISSKASILHRISIAYISCEIIKDYPVFGTGFGIKTFQNRKVIDPKAYNARLPKKYRMDEWAQRFPHLKAYTEQPSKNSGTDEGSPKESGIIEYLFKRPHNMFLMIGVRMGLVGLLFFFYLWFVAGKMCWKTMRHGKNDFLKRWGHCVTAAFVMFLVKGSLDPIFTHLTEVVLFTILAMITIVWNLNQRASEDR